MQRRPSRTIRHKPSETTDKGLERSAAILNAARVLFATEGWARLSMRAVAAKVGVTLGTVQHYYPTKEALVQAMLEGTLEDMQTAADNIVTAHAGASEAARFREAMRYFVETLATPLALGTFTELRAMASRDPKVAALMTTVLLRAAKSIARRLRELTPHASTKERKTRAGLILAQLMGLTFTKFGTHVESIGGIDDATLDLIVAIARGTRLTG